MADLNIVQMVGNVGFPIAVTIYLLHKFEKRLEKLEQAIINLSETVVQVAKGEEENDG
ncbi:YvrJ family protein [Salimicrobium salexigens]|uniref:YvrJ protein family protein n=1 Tax=Salimicrobium salexigens TaxID=908941 RepID=A0ABY1KQZ2_9BACI|nr:YvrJ family protein [Salimicrobium salexigens]SIS66766.1 YvrJ protein family protein [Salimicrobium salexigens]